MGEGSGEGSATQLTRPPHMEVARIPTAAFVRAGRLDGRWNELLGSAGGKNGSPHMGPGAPAAGRSQWMYFRKGDHARNTQETHSFD